MVNKELHLNDPRFKDWSRPIDRLVNGLFGFTGNYRLLEEDVAAASDAGFQVESIVDIPIANYIKTATTWVGNLRRDKVRLISIVQPYLVENAITGVTAEQYVNRFCTYLRATLYCFRSKVFNQQFIVLKKPHV